MQKDGADNLWKRLETQLESWMVEATFLEEG